MCQRFAGGGMYPSSQTRQASIAQFNWPPPTLNKFARSEAPCNVVFQSTLLHDLHSPISDWNVREDGSRKDDSMVPFQGWDNGMNKVSLELEEINGKDSCAGYLKYPLAAIKTEDIQLEEDFTFSVSCQASADASAAHLLEDSTLDIEHTRGSFYDFRSSSDLPSIDACIRILQEHRKSKGLLCAWRVHVGICIMGLETHPAVGNHLVPMFADCGDVRSAEQMFYRLVRLNEHSWTSVIVGYAEAGNLEHAVILYEKMLDDDIYPSSYTYVGLLKACAEFKDLERGHKFHSEISQQALERDLYIGSILVYMYAKCGSCSEAQEVFDALPVRNVVSWTAIISAYAENGPYQEALDLFDRMKLHDGAPPNSWTFACALRACGSVGSTDKAFILHSEVVQKGMEEDLYVGNALVYTYAKISRISEAQNVFDRFSIQCSVSWNILIAGYAETRLDQEVLNCFERMLVDDVSPNAATFAYVVKACGSLGSIEKGLNTHKMIILIAVEKDPSIANCLVGMYANCGFLSESQKVFDELATLSVVSWTALIGGYAEHGNGEHAVQCLKQMELMGVSPDAVTFACNLKACSSTNRVFELHKEVTGKGFDVDVSLGIALLDVYASCGLLSEAHDVFMKLLVRDVVSWTALIAGYADQGDVQEAMSLLDQMQIEGVIPDAVTCSCVMKACGSTRSIDAGRELHMDMLKKGFERDTSINNSLIGMYAKGSSLLDAQDIFDKLPVRDVVAWTSLIAGYAEHGYSQETLKCFKLMQMDGIFGDAVMFACCLKACGNLETIPEGQQLHMDTILQGLEKESPVGNTLIGMYAKWGLFVEAREVFNSLPVKDVVSWNALITGYTEHDCVEALLCLEQMQGQGVCPDAVTFACGLKACGSTGALERGRGVHSNIVRKGLDNDPIIGNCLISTYSMCGSILEAHDVFDGLLVQNVVAWCTLIKGYGMNHDGHMAVQLFEDMQENGIKPHALVFSSLLTACSHSSQAITGEEYFKVMREDFGITATEEHYSCMVDLLARSGHLYEAERFLEAFCRPYEGSWASLLTACKTFEEKDLGIRCFQQLLQIHPEEAAWYVLMADINASSRKWDCSNYELEDLRKHAGVKKMPAVALIEVNNRLHEFIVGNNPSHEIFAKLKALNSRLKVEGHVPKVNSVLKPIPDDAKEVALCKHAEKLAIAFGLLNTPQGETLRVTKSLRMCNDCHDASKIISKVERREIILRDNTCIHHFKGGLCSCGDMF